MSRPTQALILAAGLGSRLRPLTDDRPKALVEIHGKPILSHLLDACAAAGLESALLVGGYLHDRLCEWATAYRGPLALATVFNEAYDTRGNAWSVAVARAQLEGHSFVKLDGDVVIDPQLLRALIEHPQPSAIALDARHEVDEEAMKATLKPDGNIAELGKWLSLDRSAGESIGVEKIAAAHSTVLFNAIEDVVVRQGRADVYYEDVYHAMIAEGWTLGAAMVQPDHWWSEIDNRDDLQRAAELLAAHS